MPILWKNRIKKNCLYCGKEFKVKPAYVKKGQGKYCSIKCHNKARIKRIKRNCEHCGKEFETWPSKVKNGKGRFCCRECKDRAYSGENHYLWQGGVRFGEYCPKWTDDLRERVRNYFGRRCMVCGKSEDDNKEKLSVHHISYDKKVCCNGSIISIINPYLLTVIHVRGQLFHGPFKMV